ncbi:hypothetical protein MesoLjLc_21840 [Mesorhizobium sp. L-8-10]|nr:hypothetical protein MesoLjLb_22260 [Mesorhizobium sp. L-8-3]BCH30254.1 hypothetical protein MesoLjLc_21840 [Mesorhizobium sp. L-8-10]
MQIRVGPAKRPGRERTILDQPLGQIGIESEGDRVSLSFCADGIYDTQSQYRYTIRFSRREFLAILAEDAS